MHGEEAGTLSTHISKADSEGGRLKPARAQCFTLCSCTRPSIPGPSQRITCARDEVVKQNSQGTSLPNRRLIEANQKEFSLPEMEWFTKSHSKPANYPQSPPMTDLALLLAFLPSLPIEPAPSLVWAIEAPLNRMLPDSRISSRAKYIWKKLEGKCSVDYVSD